MYEYFEQIKKTRIDFAQYKLDLFSYASKTSLHSDVTTWAYGDPLERMCLDISNGKVLSGNISIENLNHRFFVKIIACLPDWEKYVNSLTLKINGVTVYDNDKTFFEQVNLGWPSLYIAVDNKYLVVGENVIEITTKNTSGAGLYVSEISLISYPLAQNLTQISVRNFVKKGARFGVAIKDEKCEFSRLVKVRNCALDRVNRYKDLCILSFIANEIGIATATAEFGGKKVELKLPKIVDNTEDFIFGMDSDDHRHDDSSETAFIFETAIFSNMGNFIQLRPQPGRNYFELISREDLNAIIGLMADFGIKYGLCDADVVMQYLPEICPKNFYGYHIHEPYLFFNPALISTPYQEHFLCEPEKLKSLKSFGEGKALYMDVLARSKQKFASDEGLTSFGSPSLMCVYEGDSGVDRLTIEPVSNLNLLVGAVRTTAVKTWGAHVPTDWYFGVPVDKVKSNKYRLAMQYLYLNGASYVYAENSLFKTNAFERCDWESGFCVDNRRYQREFFDYAISHPRKGELVVENAILYGKNEFFMWKLNDRIAELNEKDWDSSVWGKWDNAYQIAWNASEAWLPPSKKANVIDSPLNKNLFSGTPYGNVDIISVEKDLSKYKTLALLGWNTMDFDILDKLKAFVYSGGKLMISYAQMNFTDRNDSDFVYPASSTISEFIGLDIEGVCQISNTLTFNDGQMVDFIEDIDIAIGSVNTAQIIAKDSLGNGVIYKNEYGKGEVYFIALTDYIKEEQDIAVLNKTLELLGEKSNFKCDNPNVSFTVRDDGKTIYVDVINMNCFDDNVEQFTLTVYGEKITDKIKVGQIKNYLLDRR